MTLSLTLPDRIGQALKNKAQEFDMQPHDWLKQMLFAGTMNKDGVLQQECGDYILKHQP